MVGAGTMGGGIAAQLANAGWRVKLLDVANPDGARRSSAAVAGIERLIRNRPPLLFLPEHASRIEPGNTADDLDCMSEAAWIVEAIVENMEAKQSMLAAIEAHAGPNTVVTSNTSGLDLTRMSINCSDQFKSRFFGSHFLNPPRYLKLLEVIPTPSADANVVVGFVRFAEQVLGHRVAFARDSPGFISTRVWIEHLLESIRLAVELGLTIEQADYLTGAFIGRPKSGTFRMADIVGLDVVCAIAANQYAALTDDPFRSKLVPPAVLTNLVAQGCLGEKTGAGFYKREDEEILSFDLTTGTYRRRREPDYVPKEALATSSTQKRLQFTWEGNCNTSPSGLYLDAVFNSLHEYVSCVGPLVAEGVTAVDNVMKWGFQWEFGPYEIQDLRSDAPVYYGKSGGERTALHFSDNKMKTIVTEPEYVTIADLKSQGRTVIDTPVGALVDMGDGVACLELRTKMNTFGPDLCQFFDQARERAEREFRALVIGSDAAYFSAGFNLKLFLEAVPGGDWSAIDAMLHQVQDTFMALKYSPIPSVAAVKGYTLGGGCECAFACSAIQAAPELVMGLPELPAGLIPAGGAFMELLHHAYEGWDGKSDGYSRTDSAADFIVGYRPDNNAFAAKKAGLLRDSDCISHNSDRLLFEAKQMALELANSGYTPPVKRGVWAVGSPGEARMKFEIHQHFNGNRRISDHDLLIANSVAHVICGGPLSAPQEVSEQYMLNLEREVFLTLVKQPKTIARIEHLLATGKPLNN